MIIEKMPSTAVAAIMAKNYSHCPLKKRPVVIIDELDNGKFLISEI